MAMIDTTIKAKIVSVYGRHAKDTGSEEVQAGIMTARIQEITEHLKVNKKDHMARRGLIQLVGKRKKHLKYLADVAPEVYLKTVEALKIRKK
jgi:small subunit ribosomal protein S15